MTLDTVGFEIVKNSLISTAEEMGIILRRSSFSPNIKERRDFSCALFDDAGNLVAQAEHIPVHLGAMPHSVRTVLAEFGEDITEGDSIILNDPFRGGTHLPDITIVSPIFQNGKLVAFAANRAHHSDIGGGTPGSMSSLSTDVYQEGLRIPPVKLTQRGKLNSPILEMILSNVRTPRERLGDIRAQQAANQLGIRRFAELARKFGTRNLLSGMHHLRNYSRQLMLRELAKLPKGVSHAVDYLDNDGVDNAPVPIRLKLSMGDAKIEFDFHGSAVQTKGPVNAVYSVTLSAVYYVLRSITDPNIPANQGCFEPVRVVAPEGTVVNAKPPAPVAGGNVETSQRIVDVSLRALARLVPDRVCAACQGTMNNLTIGGVDNRTGKYFTYYETIAGGFGARRKKDGVDGVHSHMTNTLNTPVEALEAAYPFRVRRYELRPGSGGRGKFHGGLGITREVEILSEDANVSLLGDRQLIRPWGLEGGAPGSAGEYSILHLGGRFEKLSSKTSFKARTGDVLRVSTPGGGGFGNGRPSRRAGFRKISQTSVRRKPPFTSRVYGIVPREN